MGPRDAPARPASLWRRLAWFVGLWAISITALGAAAFVIRLFIG